MGLLHLFSLETLEINCCRRISTFALEELPSSLTCISIKDSRMLTLRLMWAVGSDWDRMKHIPNLLVDDNEFEKVGKLPLYSGKFRSLYEDDGSIYIGRALTPDGLVW